LPKVTVFVDAGWVHPIFAIYRPGVEQVRKCPKLLHVSEVAAEIGITFRRLGRGRPPRRTFVARIINGAALVLAKPRPRPSPSLKQSARHVARPPRQADARTGRVIVSTLDRRRAICHLNECDACHGTIKRRITKRCNRFPLRGRDGDCSPPPAQIPASGPTAPGSHLGS
jgi:hypothetical protein